ncbi:MAG: ABC transporter substrate-binding protein [Acidobacteria bacterium]|nr:ABC transporter substrate-binding protein [Acidobacteriota bacterium]
MMLEKRVSTFDPRVSSDSADERMRQLIFNGLTRKNEKFDPVPDLAESFESSPDFKTFTFRLRQGIKFHNDQKLSALDVKYTFDTMLAAGFTSAKKVEFTREVEPGKPLLAAIEVVDPQTVVFRCNDACPGLANMIVPVGIIPEGTTDQQAKKPIGTGPFKFENFTEDQEVVLGSNAQYFNGPPSIGRLRIKIIPDNSTRESELRKGSVDLAINADFDPITVEGLQKDAQTVGLKVETIDGTNLTHLGVNLLDPILKDVRIRQALAYAIDRDTIIRDVLRSQAKPAHSILPVAQWAYEPGVTAYGYDAERAKKLLDEAGRPEKDGQRLKLTLKTSTVSIAKKTAEAIQAQLARVGIKLEIQTLERQKLTQDMTDGNFQLYLNTSVGGNQSTDIFAFMYGAKSIPPNGQNRMRYNNPAVDKLLTEATLANQDRRKQIYSEVQKILSNELPQIYLWYPATIVVYRNRVGNLKIEPSGDWQVVRNVKLN